MYQFAVATLKHKWFVFLAGLDTKASLWRLIKHDWRKFTPSEYPHYQRQLYGDKSDQEGFNRAWLDHQNTSDHHWEWWMLRTSHDKGTPKIADNSVLPMTMPAVREMVADWLGASRNYDGYWPNVLDWPWFTRTYPTKTMHQLTRERVQQVFCELIDKGKYCS